MADYAKYEPILEMAQAAGFSRAEVYVCETEAFSVSAHGGKPEDLRMEKRAGIALRGLLNGQMGYAATEAEGEAAYQELVRAAAENAALLESRDAQFLYDGSEALAWTSAVDESLPLVPAGRKIELALAMERLLKEKEKRIASGTTSEVGTMLSRCLLLNTEGLRREFANGAAYALADPVLQDGDRQYEEIAYRFSRRFDELHAEEIVDEALQNVREVVGSVSMPSGEVPVVFSPGAGRTLLSTFAEVFSAEECQRGLSLLAGKEGEEIAAPCVTLLDDPSDGLGLAGRPFDGEGVPTQKKAVIERGVLTTLLYNLKTAFKAGKTSTGNASRPSHLATVGTAPTNFYIAPGELSPEALWEKAGDGVRIDELQGAHAGANPISGDFSLSAKGVRIRGGKLAEPVTQITVSGNFYRLLRDVQAVGNDLKFGVPGASAFGMPSLLVRGLTIAGQDRETGK